MLSSEIVKLSNFSTEVETAGLGKYSCVQFSHVHTFSFTAALATYNLEAYRYPFLCYVYRYTVGVLKSSHTLCQLLPSYHSKLSKHVLNGAPRDVLAINNMNKIIGIE